MTIKAKPKKRFPQKLSRKGSDSQGLLSSLRRVNDQTAVVVFLILLVAILFLFDAVSDQKARNVALKGSVQSSNVQSKLATGNMANQLISQLAVDDTQKKGNDVGFIVKGAVDPQLLEYFASMDYNNVKARLGVENDFVIHFEDENGRIIPIGNKWCIGSKNASINGVPCG